MLPLVELTPHFTEEGVFVVISSKGPLDLILRTLL